MATTVDYLVVGSGLTGGTIARLLDDHHREVLVLERRNHVGGNVHDFLHPSNIRIHTYGPHYFRCHSIQVWDFVQRFSDFYRYEAVARTKVSGRLEDWPPNQALLDRFSGWQPANGHPPPRNFEEACLRKMPRPLYERFVRGYTRRQWGVDPHLLSPELADRVRINRGNQRTLTPHYPVQALPSSGYAGMMTNLLAGLPVIRGVDYLRCRQDYRARNALIFTGSLDEFFDFDSGHLEYRSQKRSHTFLRDADWQQPCAQVNHAGPDAAGPIRTIEWKHLMPPAQQQTIKGTVLTDEFPFTPSCPEDFEYPVPRSRNQALYAHYRSRAAAVPRLLPCGRLGSYRYLDMDEAIASAMAIAQKLLRRGTEPWEVAAASLSAA